MADTVEGLATEIGRAMRQSRTAAGLDWRLSRWYAALADQDFERANVVMMGDSVFEGAVSSAPAMRRRAQGVLAAALRGGRPGGEGYIPTRFVSPFIPAPMTYSTTPGPTATVRPSDIEGMAWKSMALQPDGWLEYTSTCDRVRVFYTHPIEWDGTFGISLDGVEVFSSPADNSGAHSIWDSGPLERKERTVRVTGKDLHNALIEAIEFFDGDFDKGVHVYDAAHSGGVATNWGSKEWKVIKKVSPHLVVTQFGFNDQTGATPEQFKQNYGAMLFAGDFELGNGSFVTAIVKPWAPSEGNNALGHPWSAYMTALDELAQARTADGKPTVTIDVASAWPTVSTTATAEASRVMFGSDTVHPNSPGQSLYGSILAHALSIPTTALHSGAGGSA